jgi:hypothetical protein
MVLRICKLSMRSVLFNFNFELILLFTECFKIVLERFRSRLLHCRYTGGILTYPETQIILTMYGLTLRVFHIKHAVGTVSLLDSAHCLPMFWFWSRFPRGIAAWPTLSCNVAFFLALTTLGLFKATLWWWMVLAARTAFLILRNRFLGRLYNFFFFIHYIYSSQTYITNMLHHKHTCIHSYTIHIIQTTYNIQIQYVTYIHT